MINSKQCFKCETIKPLTEFYKNARMEDGYLNKCIQCCREYSLKHRADNLEKVREYDRRRAKSPERIKATIAISNSWRTEDKRRGKAHKAVAKALRLGQIYREPCCRCGHEKSLAHHDDYDHPLKIMWLCQPCHKQRHKELKEDF
jgi:hypothetical protein